MKPCICGSCKNLKAVVVEENPDQNGSAEDYECEFGYPSEVCEACEVDSCDLTCDHYAPEDGEEAFTIAACAKCGKELKLTPGNTESGDVYCVACYLTK